MIESPLPSLSQDRPAATAGRGHRFRTAFLVLEGLLALGGLAGSVQLFTDTYAPPVSALEPLGLTSWRIPAFWLFGTVVVPSVAAAVLAWARSPLTPRAVLLGCATLALELGVQIPFLGPSVLQAVCGSACLVLAALALRGRRTW